MDILTLALARKFAGGAAVSDIIAVSETEPTGGQKIWINPSGGNPVTLPEINDDEIRDDDTWSSRKISEEIQSGCQKNFVEIKKVAPYLHEIWFDNIDYKKANEYFENGGDVTVGACSAVRNGNFYGRNFDWLYNNNAEFIVHVPRIADRYASIGIATSVNTLTEEFVDSGEPSDAYGIVPFKTVDGINEFGVIANNNVVPTDKELGTIIPSGEVEVELQSTMLVRFILDHFKTAQEAVEYIQEHVKINLSQKLLGMHYEQHYMVADKDKTYLIELIGTEAVVTDMTAGANSTLAGKPYMTNFYLSDVTLNSDGTVYTPYTQDATHNAIDTNGITENGAGLERYNIIAEQYDGADTLRGMDNLMSSLKYTNAYTLQNEAQAWFTEFVGVNDTTCATPYTDFADIMVAARQMYTDRDRDNPDTWQTVHSAVYDIENLTLNVIVQESGEAVERTLEVGGGSSDAVQYVEQNLTEAQQMQARKNLGLYYTEQGAVEPIVWDGDTENRTSFTVSGSGTSTTYYKVSDRVLAKNDLVGGSINISGNGQSFTEDISDEYVVEIQGMVIIAIMGVISANAGSYYSGSYVVPEDGIYFPETVSGSYHTQLNFPASETVHKIEEKYLPNVTRNHFYVIRYDESAETVDHYSDDILAAVKVGMIPILIEKDDLYDNSGHNSFYTYSGFNDSKCVFSYWSAYSGMARILIGESNVRYVESNFATNNDVDEKIADAIGDAIGGEY